MSSSTMETESGDFVIECKDVSKCFHIYDSPKARIKQALWRGRRKYYQDFWAVKDVTLDIRQGETVGIIGSNGSGKSTLLQIICGTLTPSSGSVITRGRISALLELGSGFNPEFTGRENVYLNASILGLTTSEIEDKLDDVLSFADIGEFIEQPVKSYSSGMAVRLAFAVAINVSPDILIVDEALSVGDERFQRKCFSRIETIRESGSAILFVSHSASTITDLCDRAVLLDSGTILATGKPKSIVGWYQKLLYSTVETRPQILSEILSHDHKEFDFARTEHEPEVLSHLSNKDATIKEVDLIEGYEPGLQTISAISYLANGATIRDPIISTFQGSQVNVLRSGNSYLYRYMVEFYRDVTNLSYGMLIKAINGTEIGGYNTRLTGRRSEISATQGDRQLIEFRFACRLNPGVYFMNAGVYGEIDGTEVCLHRVLDCVSFRVASLEDSFATSLVDFSIEPHIQTV